MATTLQSLPETLYAGATRGYAVLWGKDGGSECFDATDEHALTRMVERAVAWAKREDVYFNVCLTGAPVISPGRGKADAIVGIPGLWSDVDIDPGNSRKPSTLKEAADFLKSLPLRPSLVIRSGHGLHVYWLFDALHEIASKEDRDDIADLAEGWLRFVNHRAAEHGWTFDSVFDLARVLRLPGTLNHKSDPVTAVSLIHDGHARHAVSAFRTYAIAPEPKAKTSRATSSTSLTDADIVHLADKASNGAKFHVLYFRGDVGDYGDDESRADEALLCLIAFFTRDPGQIERIFSGSALGQRDKWRERSDYRERSIEAALELVTETYEPAAEPIIIMTGGRRHDERANGTNGATPPSPPNGSNPDGGEPDPSVEWTDEATGEINLTDLGNARRLVRAHGRDLRYCKAFGQWFVWRGGRWAEDATDEVIRRAKATIGAMYSEAENLMSEERKALIRHALKSEQAQRITAMISLAASEPGIPVEPDQLDRDPWLLSVENGTIELRTGARREHRRDDLITKRAPVPHETSATCPRWAAFLAQVFPDDADVISFLKRALGSSLTGITRDRALFLLHGAGRNGKSTLLELVRETLGPDYSALTPTETLLTKRGDNGIPNDIAKLRGARFVTASEADEGRRFAQATIKQLTGGDMVSARFMRGEFFEFRPAFKLWFGTNHRPDVLGMDRAMFDRIRSVPFSVRFWDADKGESGPPDLEADKGLRDALMAERAGILAWMVQGCLEWQRVGLGYPASVKASSEGFEKDMDVVARFIEDCCDVGPTCMVGATEIYRSYHTWCESSGEKSMTQRSFGIRLKEKGFDQVRDKHNRSWIGLTITMGKG